MAKKKRFSSSVEGQYYVVDRDSKLGTPNFLPDYYGERFSLFYILNIGSVYQETFGRPNSDSLYICNPCLLYNKDTSKVVKNSELDRAVNLGFKFSNFIGIEKDSIIYEENLPLTDKGLSLYKGDIVGILSGLVEEMDLPEKSLVNIDLTQGFPPSESGRRRLDKLIHLLETLNSSKTRILVSITYMCELTSSRWRNQPYQHRVDFSRVLDKTSLADIERACFGKGSNRYHTQTFSLGAKITRCRSSEKLEKVTATCQKILKKEKTIRCVDLVKRIRQAGFTRGTYSLIRRAMKQIPHKKKGKTYGMVYTLK